MACVIQSMAANLGEAVPAAIPASPVQSFQDLNSTSVSAFADEEIPQAMRDGKIPGAVFVVVQNGQVLCEKAYGVADLKTRRPASTDQTLFRVASISKILTAASALQLVHAHKLDLHRDVNDYLTRFQIAPAFGKPVTLFNLLTHSSGFDECEFGYAAHLVANRLSLRTYLTRHQPARVRPPGLFSVYDNYGFALAGYLVQKVSGVPFADYVRERLFAPLGMEDSSFSPDAALRKRLATGYWLDGETPRACERSYVNITPAAGLCSTASDMSELLVALLTNRRPDGAKMFPASVLSGLEAGQFAPVPEVPGRCFGFNQITLAGRSALRQPGQWPGFNSVLLLFPKQHCGMFLAYNLCDDGRMDQRISRKFAETFIAPSGPMPALENKSGPPVGDGFAMLQGTYLASRSAHESPALNFPHEFEVTRLADGHLKIKGELYHELGPLVFEKIETNSLAATWFGRRVAFEVGRDGRVTHLITQTGVYRRATWLESASGRQFLVRSVSVVFLSALLLWPVMFLVRLLVVQPSRPPALESRRRFANMSLIARVTAFAACALALWFELSLALAELRLKPFAGFYGFPASVRNLLWALPVLLGLSVVLAGFSIIAWRRRLWNPVHRVHYTLLVVACGLFLYFFYSRHLLFVG